MSEAQLCDARHPSGARCGKAAGHDGAHRPRDEHHCHARGCMVATKPEMLMCRRHWFMVPRHLRAGVWATYRPGQCDDKQPSPAWWTAAEAAIAAVAEREEADRQLHPNGRCTCFGGGECDWCRRSDAAEKS